MNIINNKFSRENSFLAKFIEFGESEELYVINTNITTQSAFKTNEKQNKCCQLVKNVIEMFIV